MIRQIDADGLVNDRIPWVRFERWLEDGLYPALQETVRAGGRAAGPHLERALGERIVLKQVGVKPEFQLRNPQAERFAAAEAAELVRQIKEETRLAIRAIIYEAQRQGLAIPQQARRIRELVGLTERQALAVGHYTQRLIAQGLPADVVKAKARRYYEKLIRYRAQLIARTETIRAANRGQQALWEQAISEGYLSAQQMKTWIVTPDDRLCPLCATMDGQAVPVTQMFNTPLGPKMSPDLHPGCRCAMGLGEGTAATTPAAEPAVGPGRVRPAERDRASTALSRIDKEIADKPVEHFVAINPDTGEEILRRVGTRTSVDLTDVYMSDPYKLRNAITTHNHPYPSSFSMADVRGAMHWDKLETRVVTKDYVYSLRRPDTPKGWNSHGRLSMDTYRQEIWQETEEMVSKALPPGWLEWSDEKIQAEVTHRIMEELARKYGLRYTRTAR